MKIGKRHLQDTKFEYLWYDFRNVCDIYKYDLENGLKNCECNSGDIRGMFIAICEIMTVVHLYFERI